MRYICEVRVENVREGEREREKREVAKPSHVAVARNFWHAKCPLDLLNHSNSTRTENSQTLYIYYTSFVANSDFDPPHTFTHAPKPFVICLPR